MSKLSKQERLARLIKNHNTTARRKDESWAEVDGNMSLQITQVEKELGFPIMGDYPLMKFLAQQNDLIIIAEREKEASK